MESEQIAPVRVGEYPCGCQFINYDDGSYDHFVSPDCRLDAGKTTSLKNYRYKIWDSLPAYISRSRWPDKSRINGG